MINVPNGLKDSEVDLYIAAFKRCEERIKAKNNNTTVDETVDEIVAQWGNVVENRMIALCEKITKTDSQSIFENEKFLCIKELIQ